MNLLIVSGATIAPVDRHRGLTSRFSASIGNDFSTLAWSRGHRVSLLTSDADRLILETRDQNKDDQRLQVHPFTTFDELAGLFQQEVIQGQYDAIIHAAQWNDYLSAGVYSPEAGTFFNARTCEWDWQGQRPTLKDQKGHLATTSEPELWLRLVRAPRLIERIRKPWGYAGIVVIFVMEAAWADGDAVAHAEKARINSGADYAVIPAMEINARHAYLGPVQGRYEKLDTHELAEQMILTIEELHRHRVRSHG
jgi:phosphopantothenate---cysteine ligase (CTP)